MGAHAVVRADELGEGESIVVDVGGVSIGVFRVRGEFYALRNLCAHQRGPVCEGKITPALRAEVREGGGVREFYDHDLLIVTCPWHGWEYDITTGVCLADPRVRIWSYKTTVVDGQVFVER